MWDDAGGPGRLLPGALTTAREFREMTRAELARRSGITRQHIINLETGETPAPSRVTVEVLAEALEVLPSFLGQDPGPPPPQGILHFRGGARVGKRSKAHLLSRATVWQKLTDYMVAQCSLLPVDSFAQIDAGGDIEDAAARVRRAWSLQDDAPIQSVIRVLERAGAIVGTFEGGEKGVDAYSWQSARPLILCNTDREAPTRTRFGMLHEAAHLLRHRGRPTGDEETEAEANRFASAVLLPRRAFWQEFPRFGSRLNWPAMFEMKSRWGASIQAIVRRAYDLTIITPRQYKSACIAISSNGWRKKEPGEPLDVERPELARGIAEALAQGLAVQPSFTQAVGLPARTICELTSADIGAFPAQHTMVNLKSPLP